MRRILEATPNLSLREGMVTGLDIGPNDEICGVTTFFGLHLLAKAVVLTTGTFMNGKIWVGRASMAAGRAGEAPSSGLTEALMELGFETDRLKTGTPARVDSRTVDFSGLEVQPGRVGIMVGQALRQGWALRVTMIGECWLCCASESSFAMLETSRVGVHTVGSDMWCRVCSVPGESESEQDALVIMCCSSLTLDEQWLHGIEVGMLHYVASELHTYHNGQAQVYWHVYHKA